MGSFIFLCIYSELNIFFPLVVRPPRFSNRFVLFGKNLNLFFKDRMAIPLQNGLIVQRVVSFFS
ncbi:hypothetical protein EHQ76_13180 [Leptospira barantonii]|uniref:Uncharacterized protein n=1 Tax=Leptospira barantonii TaxID=2023184 RepID=A0A5F2B191_9LEPT|nr:hypothetical protein EHQ76_13180 [Leptospira barantonii]